MGLYSAVAKDIAELSSRIERVEGEVSLLRKDYEELSSLMQFHLARVGYLERLVDGKTVPSGSTTLTTDRRSDWSYEALEQAIADADGLKLCEGE